MEAFKVYFWVYAILNVLGVLVLVAFEPAFTPLNFADALSLFIIAVFLFGMYSYLYKPKMFSKRYWKVLFWIFLFLFIEELVEIFLLPEGYVTNLLPILKSNLPSSLGERFFGLLLNFPGLYAIYKLSFK